MGRLGFFFDIGACIGCKACQTACKDKNRLEVGLFYRRVAVVRQGGEERFYSGACNHCAAPPCVERCPAGAAVVGDDGAVRRDSGRCIGCGACEWNCPYGASVLGPSTGVSQKCDLCPDRRQAGRGPACVEACPTRCLRFGDVEALLAASGLVAVRPDFLPESAGQPALVVVDSRMTRSGS
ncbi:MAG: 4Fe-4S dicluster domain-containing protein [Planctomycetaceae bacterium]|nr:4Fe-4S dicluster domain-containing protein [Planctomycetaceae bacterium]